MHYVDEGRGDGPSPGHRFPEGLKLAHCPVDLGSALADQMAALNPGPSGRPATDQRNRVVRQRASPQLARRTSIARVRTDTHAQESVISGGRARVAKPTNVAVAPATMSQSSPVRRRPPSPISLPSRLVR